MLLCINAAHTSMICLSNFEAFWPVSTPRHHLCGLWQEHKSLMPHCLHDIDSVVLGKVWHRHKRPAAEKRLRYPHHHNHPFKISTGHWTLEPLVWIFDSCFWSDEKLLKLDFILSTNLCLAHMPKHSHIHIHKQANAHLAQHTTNVRLVNMFPNTEAVSHLDQHQSVFITFFLGKTLECFSLICFASVIHSLSYDLSV